MDNKLVSEFQEIVKGVSIIRSSEFVTIAYEKGLMNKYLDVKHKDSDLVEAFLWALRLRGCAISTEEIEEIIRFETKK